MLTRGFSLTELLMALGAGAIVITAGASLASTVIYRSVTLDRAYTISEESGLLKGKIQRELQRAGYISASLADRLTIRINPFANEWQLSSHPDELAASCVLFAYDKNRNGVLDDMPPERYGLRLRNGAIEARIAGRSCAEGGWQDLSSPDIRITHFSLSALTSPPTLVNITMTLAHRHQPTSEVSQTFSVGLPNYAQ